MDQFEKDDDTLETVYDSVLDTLTDEQFLQYLDDGTLPHGVELPSSSDGNESEGDEPPSDEDPNEVNDIETEVDKEVDEDSKSNPESEPDEEESGDEEGTPSKEETNTDDDTFKKLFSKPIKANGTEFVLENLDEAISLIQKGAGYEAKMKKIKPSMKIIKSLEENSISESEVNFLIDLHKGSKTAIKELLARHKLDTLEIDEVTDDYKPGKNMVSDEVMKLADNIDAIKNSAYADRIGEVITNTWDDASKDFIAKRPETLLELLAEFELGRFDTIQAIVARENALGKNNLPDIARYSQLAKMYQEGTLKTDKPKPVKDEVVEQSKKSAKPSPKGTNPKPTPKKKPSDYTQKELEKMTDAEYLRLFGN